MESSPCLERLTPSISIYNCGFFLSVGLSIFRGMLAGPNDNVDFFGVADMVWAFAYDFGGRSISRTMVSSIARSSEALSMIVCDGSEGLSGVDVPATDVEAEPGHAAENRRLMSDVLKFGVNDEGKEIMSSGC